MDSPRPSAPTRTAGRRSSTAGAAPNTRPSISRASRPPCEGRGSADRPDRQAGRDHRRQRQARLGSPWHRRPQQPGERTYDRQRRLRLRPALHARRRQVRPAARHPPLARIRSGESGARSVPATPRQASGSWWCRSLLGPPAAPRADPVSAAVSKPTSRPAEAVMPPRDPVAWLPARAGRGPATARASRQRAPGYAWADQRSATSIMPRRMAYLSSSTRSWKPSFSMTFAR